MKKKLFLAGAVVVMAAGTGYTAYSRSAASDLFNANVEALTQDEGTSVKQCYVEGYGSRTEYGTKCNTSTSISMIYPCESDGSIRAAATSMCTN